MLRAALLFTNPIPMILPIDAAGAGAEPKR